MNGDTTTTWLDRYHEMGWAVVPIAPGGKAPVLSDWPSIRRENHTPEEWAQMFEGQGMGVILGEASGDLVDIDLDSEAAVQVCGHLMPMTLRGGRAQAPFTHLFYRVTGMPEGLRNRQFMDPVDGGRPIMEFRVNGQTVVHPSIHPSGDEYQWWTLEAPIEIPWSRLAPDIVISAALSLLARHWPTGGRHHAAMALAGALLHDNGGFWSQGSRLEAAVEAVCMAAGDHEIGDRMTAVRDTLLAHDNGKAVTGWSTLIKVYEGVGAGAAAQTAREWLSDLRVDAEPEDDEPEEYKTGQYGMFTAHRVDVRKVLEEGVPPVTAVYPGFLWENMEHLTYGNAGSGKTMLTAHVLEYLLQRGERVVWLDYQNGYADIVRRFETMRTDPDLFENMWVIDHPPANLLDAKVLDDLQSLVLDLDAAVLVFDSMMDVLAFARSEMNSGDDFNRLHSEAIKPLRQTGRAALWFHDHAAKHDPFSAIGTSMKRNQTQIEWHIGNTVSGVTRVPNRTVGGEGFIVATAGKNRSGVVGRGHKVKWTVEPYGPTTTDPDTGIVTHDFTRVTLDGHYPPGSAIPMPGQQMGQPGGT